jgi:hypothetical protein
VLAASGRKRGGEEELDLPLERERAKELLLRREQDGGMPARSEKGGGERGEE